MTFVQNIPCISIVLPMIAAAVSLALGGRAARTISIITAGMLGALSAVLLLSLVKTGESFVYVMGMFPAPFGNELRAGMLEAGMALLFCSVVFVSIMGGGYSSRRELRPDKVNIFYIMTDLILASNLALVYTNDVFTAYVFVEISTLAACGLILGGFHDFTIAAAIRYMVMSLMGSGLVLMSICFLYDMTGNLLMESAGQVLSTLDVTADPAKVPFIIMTGLMAVGLAIKSALWPFSSWVPDAYGRSTTAASGILSGMVSKGYIFMLIKMITRVYGFENVVRTGILNVFLVFGIAGMLIGSIEAIYQKDIRKVVAYSSIAQIGYIYMGLGIVTVTGAVGSIYHIAAHAIAKTLAFVSVSGLVRAAWNKGDFRSLTGTGFLNPVAGAGFICASLSMVGIPGFGGFISKLILAEAAWEQERLWVTAAVLAALAISTLLNAIYFMKIAICIYTPVKGDKPEGSRQVPIKNDVAYNIAIIIFIAAIVAAGIFSDEIRAVITNGLEIFG